MHAPDSAAARSLYARALDAGDRLADALDAGDLDAAAHALDRHHRLVVEIGRADLPAPPDLAARFRDQHARVRRALRDRSDALGGALAAAGRAATAGRGYGAGPAPTVVDTAPR